MTWTRSVEPTFMVVLAAALGALGGLVAVAFRLLIQAVQRGAWGEWTYSLDLVGAHPWWWVMLTPAIGGLVVGPLVTFLAREARGHGVPEVMEAVALRSGVIRPRVVAVKSLASALTIGTGGSVGREGPIVQIGSALGSALGQWFRVSGSQLRTLVGCGAAAGIAATFNAPVAGALFAVEVVLSDFGVSQFSPIVISSVMATVVSRHFLGDIPAFPVPPHELVSAWELPVYGALGVIAGLIGLLFIRVLYGAEDRIAALRIPPWILPALGGLVVGGIALVFPEVLGVGYEATSDALWGRHGLDLLALLIVAKLIATSVTLGCGGSGGVFAPSLFLGAMTGGLVGGLAHQWFPAVTAGRSAYALVGMGAMVAGTTRAPITAILIIFELTSDYKLILPLMASCIVATLVASRSRHGSIYTEKLARRGIDIFRGRELNILRSLRAAEVMDHDMTTVSPDRTLGEILETLQSNVYGSIYVVTPDDRLAGVISMPDLQSALLHARDLAQVVVADELIREDVPRVTPDQRLDSVMRTFAERHPEELPVVRPEDGRLLGIVTRRKVIDAYNRELVKRDVVSGIGGGLEGMKTTGLSLGDGYHMMEIDAPGAFVHRTLGELALRPRFGVQVLLIRRMSEGGRGDRQDVVPGADTSVETGDRLVLLGQKDALDRIQG